MKRYSYRILNFYSTTKEIPEAEEALKVKYQFVANVVPTEKLRTPEEETATYKITVNVSCTYQLRSKWSSYNIALAEIETENLRKVLYEFGKKHLEEIIRSEEFKRQRLFSLELNDETAPKICPYNPANIKINHDTWFEVEVKRHIRF